VVLDDGNRTSGPALIYHGMSYITAYRNTLRA